MVQMRETHRRGKDSEVRGGRWSGLGTVGDTDTLTVITGHLRKTEGGPSEVVISFLSSPHHLSNRFFFGNRRRKRLVVTTLSL